MREFKYYASCSAALEVKGFNTKRAMSEWIKRMNRDFPVSSKSLETPSQEMSEEAIEEYFSDGGDD